MTHTEQLGVMRFVQYTDKMQAKLVKLQQLEALWRKWKEAKANIHQDGVLDSGPVDDANRALAALEAWKP